MPYGDTPYATRLQPLRPTVAASETYGCRPSHLRLQAAWTSALDGRGCSAAQAGCTNCDADPKGAWCLVDQQPCAGSEGEAAAPTYNICIRMCTLTLCMYNI